MSLKELREGLRGAAAEMRKLAAESQKVVAINEAGSVGGTVPTGAPVQPHDPSKPPINLTFVSNINTNPSSGSGSGGGGGGIATLDDFTRFLQTKGIYDIRKLNEQTLELLRAEFERMLRKMLESTGGMALRKMGMG